jgi:hypothetical protein
MGVFIEDLLISMMCGLELMENAKGLVGNDRGGEKKQWWRALFTRQG